MMVVPVKAAPVKKAPVAGGRFTYDSGVEWDTQGAESVLSVRVKTLDQLSDPSESGRFRQLSQIRPIIYQITKGGILHLVKSESKYHF